MTLDEIWSIRGNLCYVAFRTGTIKYVSLAHGSADTAFEAAESKQGMTQDDRSAVDWAIGEITCVDEAGQVTEITEK